MWLPKLNCIVGLVEIAGAEDEFRFAVALESGARHDVEDAVGAVAEFRSVAAAADFEIVDVLGIELRSEVGGDVGVGNGNAVDQPTGLMSSANVELIVGDVGARHEVGDHREAVGAGGAGSAREFLAVNNRGRRSRVGRRSFDRAGNVHRLFRSGHAESKVQHRLRAGDHHHVLPTLLESDARDGDDIFAERNGVEDEVSTGIGVDGGRPVRGLGMDHHHRILYGTMLRIMNDAAHGPDDRCDGRERQDQKHKKKLKARRTHEISK